MPPATTPSPDDLTAAFTDLAHFLGVRSLTTELATIESGLTDATAAQVDSLTAAHGLTIELLASALTVRSAVGRLNDVIHAATIALTLPHILEPGERITTRPSLGAGNDASRPFDLETDQRIAEFKVAQWKGKDTMRKRGVFTDLVHLALDSTGRRAQLYIVGNRPPRFLRTSAVKASWALGRSSPHTRARFADVFDPESTMTVADFTRGPAAHIDIIDLADIHPALATAE